MASCNLSNDGMKEFKKLLLKTAFETAVKREMEFRRIPQEEYEKMTDDPCGIAYLATLDVSSICGVWPDEPVINFAHIRIELSDPTLENLSVEEREQIRLIREDLLNEAVKRIAKPVTDVLWEE